MTRDRGKPPDADPGRPSPRGADASEGHASDSLDRELVERLNRRAAQLDQPAAFDEAAWAGRLDQWNDGPLHTTDLVYIFRELMTAASRRHASPRVAFLGPLYSFSHLAAIRRFGRGAELVPVQSIGAVFDEVRQGSSDYGLVPLANSTDGRIVDTLGSFVRFPVRISGEIPLRIHHHLMGRGPRHAIRFVCSKPQALSQCRRWLAQHVPHATLVETPSTTAAAERAAGEEGVAAVASREAAVHYGLPLLAENIEDAEDNVTRFAVIGGEPPAPGPPAKTAFLIELPHRTGALAGAMEVFRNRRLNLTWLESFPKPGAPREYLFFVELEGHQADPEVAGAVEDLRRVTVDCQVLGCYRAAEPID